MKLKHGINLFGLQEVMRPVLIAAETIWMDHGQSDGVTVTSTVEGVHSARSLHPFGKAVDLRVRYFPPDEVDDVADDLRIALGKAYDVINFGSHIHVEYDPK